jgi:hypothetical protein
VTGMDCALQNYIVMRRFDGPFRALVLLVALSASSLGCLGYSFAAASRATFDAEILDTDKIPPPADL